MERYNLKSTLKVREKKCSYPILLFGGCGEGSKLQRDLASISSRAFGVFAKLHENNES